MSIVLVVIASLLALVGNIPYLRDVIKGVVRPHPYTWFIWSIVSAVVLAGMVVKGAGVGAIPTLASEIFTFIIFIVSLKYGFKDIRPIDHLFLVVALAGLVPWFLTKDPTISVIVVVAIDLIAFMPTIRKTWKDPRSESPLLYATNVLRHILIMFSLEAYNIATTLHSIAMIVVNTIMTGVITLCPNRRPKK